MDREHKRNQAILVTMAHQDPNVFLRQAYAAGMNTEDLADLGYLINIARRALGYDPDGDPFLTNDIG